MSIFFTANQANDALPDVIKKFEHGIFLKNQIKNLGCKFIKNDTYNWI